MKLRYCYTLFTFLLFQGLSAQNTLKLFGDVNTQDEARKVVQTSDGNFLYAGRVGNDAVLFKLDCVGTVVDSLRKDLSGLEDFYDVAELPNGEILAVGSYKTATYTLGLMLRTDANLQELAFDTLLLNGLQVEFHSIVHTGSQWILGGIIAGATDYVDAFTTRFNPATLAPTGTPAIFSYGVLDNLSRVSPTSDGSLLVCGGSVQGDIFDPEAVLNSRAFVRKTKPDGSLIWEHVEEQQVKTKFGQTYFSDALENPLTGNLLAAGRCFIDSTLRGMDPYYVLLTPAGDSLSSVAIPRISSENLYQTIAFPDATFGTVFFSVGDSIGQYYNGPVVVVLTEFDSTIVPLTAFSDPANPLSPRTILNAGGQNAFGAVYYLPGGPTGVNQDFLAATPPPLDSAVIERFGNTLEATQPEGGLQYQWFLDDVPIPGATQMTLAFDTADYGTYKVVVSAPTGCTSVATYEVLVGTGAPDMPGAVRVFPNPFGDWLGVKGETGRATATVTLCDAAGRRVRVLQQDWKGEQAVFPVKNLPAGVYSLEIKNAAGLRIFKVVKGY